MAVTLVLFCGPPPGLATTDKVTENDMSEWIDGNGLRDAAGTYYTRPEVLRMGLARFETKWYGPGSTNPPALYYMVANEDNRKRLRHLHPAQRKSLEALDKAVADFDDDVYTLCNDMIRGGTAIEYDGLDLSANWEECLGTLLPGSPQRIRARSEPFGHVCSQIATETRRFREMKPYPSVTHYQQDIESVSNTLSHLKKLCDHQPAGVNRAVAAHLSHTDAMLHLWAHIN